MEKSIISVKNLSKTFSYYKKQTGLFGSIKSLIKREKLYTKAVDEISFEIAEGELVGFLGPNGAGKTTTLKMLAGILYPTSGEAKVLGYTPWQRQAAYQKQFSLVMGQKNQLWWDLPAMESFLLNKEIYEISNADFKRNLDELVELLDIKDVLQIQVRKLSLGQRMKCELVAALLHQPKILFLDEPTIGLDIISQQKIREFIKKYNQEKKTTILLTSHYMQDVEALAKRLIIIDHGKLIYTGSITELKEKYADIKFLEISFSKPVPRESLEKLGRIKEYTGEHVILSVPYLEHKKIAARILEELPVDDILIKDKDIESIISKIFKTGG